MSKHGWSEAIPYSSDDDSCSDESFHAIEVPLEPQQWQPQLSQEDEELVSVKKIIRSLVLPHAKKGMNLFHLTQDYRDLEGTSVPFERFGHHDLVTFLKSINDTVICFKTKGVQGQDVILLRPVSTESTKHIQEMVVSQRSAKRRKKNNNNGNKKQNNRRKGHFNGNNSFNGFKSGNNWNGNNNNSSNWTPTATPNTWTPRNNVSNKKFKNGFDTNVNHWNHQLPSSFDFNSNTSGPFHVVNWPS